MIEGVNIDGSNPAWAGVDFSFMADPRNGTVPIHPGSADKDTNKKKKKNNISNDIK